MRTQVLGLVAEHLRPIAFFKASDTVTDGAFRRLAQKVDLELLARFARADCHGRTGTFDCSGIDWFIERARTLGVEHKPPAPILLGRHLIETGCDTGTSDGRDPACGLRTAAGWSGDDARGGDRAGGTVLQKQSDQRLDIQFLTSGLLYR